ncbi:unnamed protein product, partial [Brassica rapa subsp. trilocularis]
PLRPSKFSFEYLLLPPRSAPTATPPGLAPYVFKRPPRPPTHRGLALAPTAGYRSHASAPSIFGATLDSSNERFARQYRCGHPPEFPLASPRSGIAHHLLGLDRHSHTRTLLRRSRSVVCAPVRDPANQLPCSLRVYSPVDLHTCQTPWSVFQDGSNGEPTGRRPEHADAEAPCEARAADHD